MRGQWQNKIAVSGAPGSGKSAVSERLARRLNVRRVSTGELQRSIANELGLTTLETNVLAESRRDIDERVDAALSEIALADEGLVLDSRLAWHFVERAFKVHLVVDPSVGADRLLARGASEVEKYETHEDAVTQAYARRHSERMRFKELYDVDIDLLRNYHLVIDTTAASCDEVVAEIEKAVSAGIQESPALLLDPRRVLPTDDLARLGYSDARDLFERLQMGYDRAYPIEIGYSAPFFMVLDGHRRLSGSVRLGIPLIPGRLVAEDGEEVIGGVTAEEFLRSEIRRGALYDWESVHGFRYREYPDVD